MDATFRGSPDGERARPDRRGVRRVVEDLAAPLDHANAAGRGPTGTAGASALGSTGRATGRAAGHAAGGSRRDTRA